MNEQPTPETDKLDRSLKNKYTPVEDCYYQMKIHSCRLEIDRDEQRRILVMSRERECDLCDELQRERALADQLADALKELLYYDLQDVNLGRLKSSRDAIAAWKEARSE